MQMESSDDSSLKHEMLPIFYQREKKDYKKYDDL